MGIAIVKKNRNSGHQVILMLCITIIFTFKTSGQQTDIFFQYFTTDQGLSQNLVDCILKDDQGFIWFGTWNGLNRFDGYQFEVYKYNQQDSNSISSNFIYSIAQDHFGNLWVGTGMGLNVYIYEENRFVRCHQLSAGNKTNQTINNLYTDHFGNIWIAWDNGISIISPIDNLGNFKDISESFNNGLFEKLSVTSFYEKDGEQMFIGSNSGLFQLDYSNLSNKRVDLFETPENSGFPIMSLHIEENNLWIGFEGRGAIKYHLENKTIKSYSTNPEDKNSLVHNTVKAIASDSKGSLILGTLGGLSIYNPLEDNFVNYTSDPDKKYSLNNNFVNSILADSDGYVWVGTEKGGVSKYNIYRKKFQSLGFEIGENKKLSHNTINSIYDDGRYIWIGTAGGGLDRYDKKMEALKVYRFKSNDPSSLSSDFVTSIYRDRRGNMWIGTWGGGIHKLQLKDQEKGNFIGFQNNLEDSTSLINNFISSVTEGPYGNIWIATLGGLDVYNPDTEKFAHIQLPENIKPIDEVGCLLYDNNGNLWAGTEHGLYIFMPTKNGVVDQANPKVLYLTADPQNNSSLSGNYIISLFQDYQKNIWIGTYGNGFNRCEFKPGEKPVFKRYTENNGLSNNVVYGMLDDAHGNLWLSTENGLSRFNIITEKFKNYYQSDGLLSNQFYWSASHKNNQGTMYFGGMKGLNMFHPDSIHDNQFYPNPAFTGLKIYSQQVEVGKSYDGVKVLDKVISASKKIELSHRTKEFTIEFSALHYDQPEKNKYQYKLENFDKGWNTVSSSKRYATYSNLDGGDYTFYLRASNNDDLWKPEPIKLEITIIPPWWKTWWFRIAIIVLVTGATLTYIRIRIYNLKVQKLRLEKKVVERTAKIEEQKEELQSLADSLLDANIQLEEQKTFVESQNEEILEQRDKLLEMNKKVQAANQQRINFFTNISHEFRTPLTLILSPLEQLVNSKDVAYELKQKFQIMYKNARRLFNLINQLMELRKVETGKLDLKASKDDFVKFVTAISQSFHELSLKRNLNFLVDAVPEKLDMYFDHEKLENIVYNLLSNAFKYTPENGTVNLQITKKQRQRKDYSDFVAVVDRGAYKEANYNDFVEISVTDTGIGVEQSLITEIFKMFYRSPSIEGTHVHGTGIGLSLVKELVKAHRGLLFVKSQKNKGSVFCALFPTDEKYLLPEEMVEDNESLAIDIKKSKPSIKKGNEGSTSGKLIDLTKQHLPQILIVEDNHDLRTYLANELSESFKILEAVNGREGLEMANLHSPDLIISDIMMPEIDGFELCTKIKSTINTSHIPVVLLTAKTGIDDRITGYNTGADEYIAKPFNIEVLKSRVQNILKNKEEYRKLFVERSFAEPKKITSNHVDEQFIKEAIKTVENNYHSPDFSVEKFASLMNMSRSLLHKKLVAIVGNSPIDFITSIRMKKAVSLLLNSGININEVAYKVGFNDPKYFSRCFKRQMGKTPSEFLKEHQ